MDIHGKLDEIVTLLENARAMPMSASCIVNRGELLDLLDEARQLLPEELDHAEMLLRDREVVLEEGRGEAARIIEHALTERDRLVSESEVHREAVARAEQLLDDARADAAMMRQEVDDYVDTKLATFEIALTRTLGAVQRGRDKLRDRDREQADSAAVAAGDRLQAAG